MRRLGVVGLVLLAVAGCKVYPNIEYIGSVSIRTEYGRVLQPAPAGGRATVYVDVVNLGGAGDTLLGVLSDVASRAELRSRDARIEEIDIPAASRVLLASDGQHVELYDLRQELKRGDVIIVTLLFKKSGAIGAITAVQ